MKTSAASILSSFLVAFPTLSTVTQAFVYPVTPIGSTVWKPDTTVTISWTDDQTAPTLASEPVFDIFLMTGADDQQTKLATVSSDVNGGTTKDVKYKVPFVYPPGQIYFLMFQTKNQNATTWATRFTITDINGNHGMLHPVIPPGGKINPGGLGQIISAEKAQELSEGNKASPKMSTHGNVNSNSNRNSPDSSSPAYLHGVAKSSLGRGVDSTGLTNNAGSLSSSKGTSLDTGAHSGQSDQANNITRNSGISSTASSFVIAAAIFFTALMGF